MSLEKPSRPQLRLAKLDIGFGDGRIFFLPADIKQNDPFRIS